MATEGAQRADRQGKMVASVSGVLGTQHEALSHVRGRQWGRAQLF